MSGDTFTAEDHLRYGRAVDETAREEASRRKHKIDLALLALSKSTLGDWWVCDRGELHSDPAGSVKIAKCVDGANYAQRSANRDLISAARELALEVVALRAENALLRRGRADLGPSSVSHVLEEAAWAQLSLLDPLKGGQNG